MERWHLIIYVPAYNAESTLGELLNRVENISPELGKSGAEISSLIIVDDGSTDSTPEILSASKLPYLKIIRKNANEGAVSAVFDGMSEAGPMIEKDSAEKTIMVRMDSDLEHQPEDIPTLIKPIIEGSVSASVGYIPFDKRSGEELEKFNRETGFEESREFLEEDIPQFCPAFLATKAGIFQKFKEELEKSRTTFEKEYSKPMVTLDFVSLFLLRKMGKTIAVVKLSPIQDKYIKPNDPKKISDYREYHKKTCEFLRKLQSSHSNTS